MAVQKREKLLFKRSTLMMLPLVQDVCLHVWYAGLADSECPIAILPREFLQIRKFRMDPGRRAALDQLRGFGRSHRCGCTQKKMNMVVDPADLNWLHAIRCRNSTQILPDSLFDVGFDPGFSILCAEDNVIVQRRVGIGHVG